MRKGFISVSDNISLAWVDIVDILQRLVVDRLNTSESLHCITPLSAHQKKALWNAVHNRMFATTPLWNFNRACW